MRVNSMVNTSGYCELGMQLQLPLSQQPLIYGSERRNFPVQDQSAGFSSSLATEGTILDIHDKHQLNEIAAGIEVKLMLDGGLATANGEAFCD